MVMTKARIQYVESLAEYESGCQEHDKCLGHLVRSPSRILLPMQSLSVCTPVMKNDMSKAAVAALEGSSTYHTPMAKSISEDSLKGKRGRMRKGIIDCHINGSLRMVITPQSEFEENIVCVPKYLAIKWRVVYLDEDTSVYKPKLIEEGGNVVAERPPALNMKSLQGLKVAFWDRTCMGVSPYILKAFAGDCHGDETYLYPVYSKARLRVFQLVHDPQQSL